MRYLHILILLAMSVLIYAENQLDVVWQMQGEQPSDCFGYYVESLDFNGDGIDDLAVSAWMYRNDTSYPNQHGKFYIYYGSDNGLPNEPNLHVSAVVDTLLDWQYSWMKIRNLGDMNNDGCDDIGYFFREKIFYDGRPSVSYYCCRILCGNTVNDTIPDYEFEVNYSESEINPLGDINGDGYDDAGITEFRNNILTYSIVYGGSFEKVTFVDGIYTLNGKGFRGLGDVNGDGYDDFNYYYQTDNVVMPDNTLRASFHNCFFLGSTVQDTIPDYRLNILSPVNLWYELYPAGDWDGDGYDDFVLSGYDVPEDGSTSPGCRLWRGSETIHWDWYGHVEYYSIFVPVYGDLNNDGHGDLVNSFTFASGNLGYLYVYLGDQNGTKDFSSSTYEDGYGAGRAIGDFNNDGFNDIAVGAYGDGGTSDWNWGYVYVYGGHEDLVEQDTNDADDETVSPADITFNAYPNPFNPEVSFEIKTDTEYHDLTIEIYNIRGQKVETIAVDHAGEAVTWKPKDKASGIYTCKLTAEGKQLSTRKVTLLK